MNVREKLLEELENNNSDLSDADLSTSPNTYREQKVVIRKENLEKDIRILHYILW